MAITSQSKAIAYPDNLQIENWQQAGLLKPSVIKPIVTTVLSQLVLRKLGVLSFKDKQQLESLIVQILGRSLRHTS